MPVLEIAESNGQWNFTLHRPDKMNALNAELVEALLGGIDRAHAAHARLLVFSGSGNNFSAGFDQADLASQSDADLLLRFVRIEMLLQRVATSPCLTVALAHGKNFGAGVDLFAACRHRYSTSDASFRMPGLRFGLVLGTRRFADLVGRDKASEILEETRSFTAAEGLAIGLVTKHVELESRPAALVALQRIASLLDRETQAHLYRVLDRALIQEADRDLADLVRSAARPGLKARIENYLSQRS